MSFSYVPFYREVAARVLEYENRQDELLDVLREMKSAGLKTTFLEDNEKDGTKSLLKVIDPFTFMANFSRTGDPEAAQLCAWLRKKWDLSADSPEVFDGRVNVSAQNPWFFASTQNGRSSEDVPLLWQLARQSFEATVSDLDLKLFERCLQIVNVAPKKLTTGLSWFSPAEFLSLAGPILPYLENRGVEFEQKKLQKGDLDEYVQLLKNARSVNSDYSRIAHDAWNWNQKGRPDDKTSTITKTDQVEKKEIENLSLANFPLNQILYGPPGTGKTYSTIERAVEIIDGVAARSHVEAKARFDELRKNGQIEFVTFHQSFSYEEFIEGLRPVLDEGGEGTARYEVRDGVLKTLALRASRSRVQAANPTLPTFDQVWGELLERIESEEIYKLPALTSDSDYVLSVTRTGNLKGNVVKGEKQELYTYYAARRNVEIVFAEFRDSPKIASIQVSRLVPYIHPSFLGAVVEELKRIAKEIQNFSAPQNASTSLGFEAAWNELKRRVEAGELTEVDGLTARSLHRLVFDGDELEGENSKSLSDKRFFTTNKAAQQAAWDTFALDGGVNSARFDQIEPARKGHRAFGAVIHNLLRKIANESMGELKNPTRYVLIIDEINRGNISKILGELITLLEPDKRIGADTELRVQLPVSGEHFALPPNLYLLGTMNTADKSLALLDVALRRRFDFIEMAPQNALFPDFAREVLRQLNLRLEVALDREHRIGHAVFIGCDETEFNAIFRAKIIPLLQEFFYNDWETLRAVLGESGENSAFIKKLAAPAGMKARTKWRWWFDVDEARDFDFLAQLEANYAAKSE